MGNKKKLGNTRLDKYYHLAKEQGYRSRAAFKLIQLNREYDFLSNARRVLDLCAAPGGWLQVASKTCPVGSLILGVDLVPIRPIRGAKSLVGDITAQETRALLRREAGGLSYDVVLCDGAPNIGGAWDSEAHEQNALALEALRLATDCLAPGGTFVTKVFRSRDYAALLYALKALFDRVDANKPLASRSTSAEIFVVCRGFKAPSKIDPRLLDPRHLFKEVEAAPLPGGADALLRNSHKRVRNRGGYADGLSSSRVALPAAAFILGASAVQTLASSTALDLRAALPLSAFAAKVQARSGAEDGADGTADAAASTLLQSTLANMGGIGADVPGLVDVVAFVRGHPATSSEIRALCEDLLVLGRSEFKKLLKWRLAVRDALCKEASARRKARGGEDGEDAEEAREDPEAEEDPEQKLLGEMAALQEKMALAQKKERKKRREARLKAKASVAAMSEAAEAAVGVGEEERSLFSLRAVRGGRGIFAEADVADVGSSESDAPESEQSEDDGLSDDSDVSDAERERYDRSLDSQFEREYDEMLELRGRQRRAAREQRRRLGQGGEMDSEEEDGLGGLGEDGAAGSDSEDDAGGLVVRLEEDKAGVPKSGDAAAAQWFGQDIFEQAGVGADAGSSEDEDEQTPYKLAGHARVGLPDLELDDDMDKGEDDSDVEPPVRDAETVYGAGRSGGAAAFGLAAGRGDADDRPGDDFEIVPRGGEDVESDSEDELDALDDDAKAELMALAKKMLRRKVKDNIVEAAYNRYAFHDANLPKWFEDDEIKHMRPIPQVTADELQAAKDELKAVDARPIKKVAEAKARKKARLARKLTQARQKAEAVANQGDASTKQKMREIEKIYNDVHRSSRGKKSKKGGRDSDRKRKGPPLDPRMRKDKRGEERASKKRGGKSGRGRGGRR